MLPFPKIVGSVRAFGRKFSIESVLADMDANLARIEMIMPVDTLPAI